jgi:hypothetical protein
MLWLECGKKPACGYNREGATSSNINEGGTVITNNFTWNRGLARCVKTGQPEKRIEIFFNKCNKIAKFGQDLFTFFPVLNKDNNL